MLTTLIAYAAIGALQQQTLAITEAERKQTIEILLDALNESYVFPELAEQADAKIRKLLEDGEYQELTSGSAFARKLSADINAVLNDAHFRVRYSAKPLPERAARLVPSKEERDAMRNMVRRNNAGIEKVELLPGNIGYIEVRSFMGGPEIARPAAAAFEFIQDTDALIIDLRRNGGGSPEAIRILCSYLFGKEPVHINSIYWRPTDRTTEYWTLEELPGPRYLDKPVYVLTSRRTGSGAEECAYNLQTQKRATIVGGVTWGGANPGGTVRLNDHFSAFVPQGRAINPVTNTNWEGTGVKPDVEVDPDKALAKAQELALEQMIESTQDEAWAESLKRRLAELESDGR
ncbi:MAG: S41 family peptidase [Armatimonadetes bacterium]|nr:S41 family peptidase [Armatimonadota bacterium]